MKVCIVGAGAIGGFIGARLAAKGDCHVAALARGATLKALREHGWRLLQDGTLIRGPALATQHAGELGVQDLVIIAVKGPSLAAVAQQIGPLLGPNTAVLPAMNGVPWWFAQGLPVLRGETLRSVDPGGHIAKAIPYSHVVGCVVHAGTSISEPGLVKHKTGRRLVIGEPDKAATESDTTESIRVTRVAELLSGAGFDVTVSSNIRSNIWYKLWGNLTMNPLSAITGATTDRMLDDPLVLEFCSAAMKEAAEIGASLGCEIVETPNERHEVTRKLGAFRTSMLQDVDAHHMIELDSIVGAVYELGCRLGLPTPNIAILLGLTRLFGRVHGLYPEASTTNGDAA